MSADEIDKPINMTYTGFAIPMVTGALSACCSLVILNVIRKSEARLSTTYHRIMAAMSIFDILTSLCMSMTTLPMPSDNLYEFDGPMLGNHTTCQIQGWFIIFGVAGGSTIYTCLSVYFVCKMAFHMNYETIKRIVEPIMFIYTLFVALFVPSYFLSLDLINPDQNAPFCNIAPYPVSCDQGIWIDHWSSCYWGPNDSRELYWRAGKISLFLYAVHMVLIVIAMMIIIWTTMLHNRMIRDIMKHVTRFQSADSPQQVQNLESEPPEPPSEKYTPPSRRKDLELRYTRVVVIQALMYMLAFIVTFLPTLVMFISGINSTPYHVANLILIPMQGFWNMIIFIYDKAYLIHKRRVCETYWDSIKMVLSSPNKIPDVYFTQLSLVDIKARQEVEDDPKDDIDDDLLEDVVLSAYDGISQYEGNMSEIASSEGISANVSRIDDVFPTVDQSATKPSLNNKRESFVQQRRKGQLNYAVKKSGLAIVDIHTRQEVEDDPKDDFDDIECPAYDGLSLYGSIPSELVSSDDVSTIVSKIGEIDPISGHATSYNQAVK